MGLFTDQFLDDLRDRVPVSAVVGRAHQLRKQGHEFVAVDDASLTVNDSKRLWHDFGKRDDGGDIFDWCVKVEGRTFPEAVEICASIAGLPMPNGTHGHKSGAENYHAAATSPSKGEAKREVEATFDYRAANGDLVMQVVRYVFRLPDGSYEKTRDGKRKKLHLQRRPDGQGGWIWKMEGVTAVPYRLPEVIEAIADDKTIFVVEGEKKVDALAKLGLVGTCNPAGAGKWPAHFAEHFAGARIVIMPDNDEAGRKHANQVGENLEPVAASVMVLDLPDLPPKGDVVDWIAEGGTAAELEELVGSARPWVREEAAAAFVSRFGLRRWEEIGRAGQPYPWTVENIIPEGESIVIYGQSGSGKSFDSFDLAMSIARGLKFNGYNVEPGLVVYVAAEAGKGFEKRKLAYCTHHGLRLGDALPFALLTKRADLFKDDADTDALIAEIKGIVTLYTVPLRAIFLDTVSALTPGMNENASQDVSKVRLRVDRIKDAFGVSTILVHHSPKGGGGPRGHGSFTADFETTIAFETVEDLYDDGRPVHRAAIVKQREGKRGLSWEFTLEVIEVGKNKWGNPETSCVVIPRERDARAKAGPPQLTPQHRRFMEALVRAVDAFGVPPATVNILLPRSVTKVVDYQHVKAFFARGELNDGEDPRDHAVRLRQALSRARKELAARSFIGADNPYIWPTGRRFDGMGVTGVTSPDVTAGDDRTESGQSPDNSDIETLFGR